MPNARRLVVCPLCRQSRKPSEMSPAAVVYAPVRETIEQEHPAWKDDPVLCRRCRAHYRAEYFQRTLEAERGEISALEAEVIASLKEHETLSQDTHAQWQERLSPGDRISDRVASFGGSWTFILSFGAVLVVWIALNSWAVLFRPFDPYPYILLNLVLSCLAALQAPVIMMSQNRQEAKDRLRSENDYRVNLKAELEIRHLHSKIDQILHHQWERLMEIQRLQMDLMEEMRR